MRRERGLSRWDLFSLDSHLEGFTWVSQFTAHVETEISPLINPSDSWCAGLAGLRNHQVNVIRPDNNVVCVNRRSDNKPLFVLRRIGQCTN